MKAEPHVCVGSGPLKNSCELLWTSTPPGAGSSGELKGPSWRWVAVYTQVIETVLEVMNAVRK